MKLEQSVPAVKTPSQKFKNLSVMCVLFFGLSLVPSTLLVRMYLWRQYLYLKITWNQIEVNVLHVLTFYRIYHSLVRSARQRESCWLFLGNSRKDYKTGHFSDAIQDCIRNLAAHWWRIWWCSALGNIVLENSTFMIGELTSYLLDIH